MGGSQVRLMLGSNFTAFLDAYPTPAIVASATGVISFFNQRAHQQLNPDSELLAGHIEDLLPDWSAISDEGPTFLKESDGRRRSCYLRKITWSKGPDTYTAALIEIQREDPVGPTIPDAELRLRYVIEMLPHAMCVFDANDRFVLWNQKYADLYPDIAHHLKPGIPFEEILKLSLASGGAQEVVPDEGQWLEERMRKFHLPLSQEEHPMQDGRWLRYDDRRMPDGGAIGIRFDITQLKQREEWLRQLFDANPMPMLLCDGNSLQILEANTAAIDFYGFDRDELLSKTAHSMHVEDAGEQFADALRQMGGHCEARTIWQQRKANGSDRHVMIYVRLLFEVSDRRLLLTIADVSDRVQAEKEANCLAHRDALTGLPNRMQFYKALDSALLSAKAADVVVLCLDLDGFKPVNDTFGHAAGDEVLKIVADRLRIAGGEGLVARLGGDEFTILLTQTTDASVVAENCVAAMSSPFLIKGISISLGVSIGIAVASHAGLDGETLIQAADRALYEAKAAGRNTWRIASQPKEEETLDATLAAPLKSPGVSVSNSTVHLFKEIG